MENKEISRVFDLMEKTCKDFKKNDIMELDNINKSYIYTHIWIDGLTNKQIARKALKAMNDLTGLDNGTVLKPYELASSVLKDGRTLIRTIADGDTVNYNDGFHIVECDGDMLYVDFSGNAYNESPELKGYKRIGNDEIGDGDYDNNEEYD